MNALADKAHKQLRNATQLYALHNMAILFNNHPYVSSSKFSADWHATVQGRRQEILLGVSKKMKAKQQGSGRHSPLDTEGFNPFLHYFMAVFAKLVSNS